MKLSYIVKGMWISKYRPESFDTIVLAEDTKKLLLKWKKEGEFPNLLLCSRPGMGKTSLAHIIAKEFDCDKLYINASDEGNVDTIRNKVKDFSITASLNGNLKVVILDEADGFANIQSQKILRALMEEVADTCRFIITANYRHKIIEPIISRCVELDMNPPKKEMIRRCMAILKEEKVNVVRDEFMKIPTVVEAFYPDMRSVVKSLQSCVDENNNLVIKEFKAQDIFISNLVEEIIKGNAVNVRKFIIEHEVEFNSDYNILLMSLYKFMIATDSIDYSIRAEWTIILCEYLYRMTSSIDAEICMAACIAEMCKKITK
jgi:DNA polymerase III delta prime subunit